MEVKLSKNPTNEESLPDSEDEAPSSFKVADDCCGMIIPATANIVPKRPYIEEPYEEPGY
jgi:hypothetical protein